jgi:hypothetical protein
MRTDRGVYQHNPIQIVFDALSSWWKRRASIAAFDQIGADEEQNVARDLGTSVAELRLLAGQGADSANLLQRRLLDLKIDPAAVEPAVMRDLQRCCSQCGEKALCEHELEDRPKSAKWPRYCPNEQTIDALKSEKDERNAH